MILKHCVWWSGQCVLQFDDLIFSSRRTTTVSDCICSTMSAIRPVQFCLLEESRERRRREKRLPLFYSKTLKSTYNCPTFPFGILRTIINITVGHCICISKMGPSPEDHWSQKVHKIDNMPPGSAFIPQDASTNTYLPRDNVSKRIPVHLVFLRPIWTDVSDTLYVQ